MRELEPSLAELTIGCQYTMQLDDGFDDCADEIDTGSGRDGNSICWSSQAASSVPAARAEAIAIDCAPDYYRPPMRNVSEPTQLISSAGSGGGRGVSCCNVIG